MTAITIANRARRQARDASDAISRYGERHDLPVLVYHPGIMYIFDWYARRNAPGFAQRLFATFGPVRYLDVGAGTGRFADALRDLGASADACERSRVGRMLATTRGGKIMPFDLTRETPGPIGDYDVAFCLEVAEHVTPELGDRLVAYLARFPIVVFTAAHPGQGGTGHINEQPKDYWEERFAAYGRRRDGTYEHALLRADGDIQGKWLLDNLMVYAT